MAGFKFSLEVIGGEKLTTKGVQNPKRSACAHPTVWSRLAHRRPPRTGQPMRRGSHRYRALPTCVRRASYFLLLTQPCALYLLSIVQPKPPPAPQLSCTRTLCFVMLGTPMLCQPGGRGARTRRTPPTSATPRFFPTTSPSPSTSRLAVFVLPSVEYD